MLIKKNYHNIIIINHIALLHFRGKLRATKIILSLKNKSLIQSLKKN